MTNIMINISNKDKVLKPEVFQRIRNSKMLKALLMQHFNIASSTLQKWLAEENVNFTQYKSLELIAQYLNVDSVEDLLIV